MVQGLTFSQGPSPNKVAYRLKYCSEPPGPIHPTNHETTIRNEVCLASRGVDPPYHDRDQRSHRTSVTCRKSVRTGTACQRSSIPHPTRPAGGAHIAIRKTPPPSPPIANMPLQYARGGTRSCVHASGSCRQRSTHRCHRGQQTTPSQQGQQRSTPSEPATEHAIPPPPGPEDA